MINDLYNTGILSLAANIKHVGSLEAPHGSSRQVSKLCGSWVEADVKIADGKVEDFAIRLQACALGQTSASILSENVIGASLDELTTVRSDLHAMLKENGAPQEAGLKDWPCLNV